MIRPRAYLRWGHLASGTTLATFALALTALAACGSSASEAGGAQGAGGGGGGATAEGEAVTSPYPLTQTSLGVPMPADTRQVSETPTIGNEGLSENTIVLLTEAEEAAARSHFAALPGASAAARGCSSVNGVQVCVFAPPEVPRHAGIREAPTWAGAWIQLYTYGEPDPCPPCPAVVPGCSCPPE